MPPVSGGPSPCSSSDRSCSKVGRSAHTSGGRARTPAPHAPVAPLPIREHGRSSAPTDFAQMDMVPDDRVQIRCRPDLGMHSVSRSVSPDDPREKVVLMSMDDGRARTVDARDCVFLDPQPYEVMARDVVMNINKLQARGANISLKCLHEHAPVSLLWRFLRRAVLEDHPETYLQLRLGTYHHEMTAKSRAIWNDEEPRFMYCPMCSSDVQASERRIVTGDGDCISAIMTCACFATLCFTEERDQVTFLCTEGWRRDEFFKHMHSHAAPAGDGSMHDAASVARLFESLAPCLPVERLDDLRRLPAATAVGLLLQFGARVQDAVDAETGAIRRDRTDAADAALFASAVMHAGVPANGGPSSSVAEIKADLRCISPRIYCSQCARVLELILTPLALGRFQGTYTHKCAARGRACVRTNIWRVVRPDGTEWCISETRLRD